MNVVISSGHGLYVRGASGPEPWGLDEVDEARSVVERVAEHLRQAGVQVTTFHDDVSRDQNANLHTIVDFHNSKKRDLDCSVHFNAYEVCDKPMGTECLYVSQSDLASDVSESIALAGDLLDRGAKQRTDLFFLNNTTEPAILIEVCFVDSAVDCGCYLENFDDICLAIAETIGGVEIGKPGQPEAPVSPVLPPPFDAQTYDVICQIAMEAPVADYDWNDRGQAPPGYVMGMALAWAQLVERYYLRDSAVLEMSKPDTEDPDHDALSWYADEFKALGMSNDDSGIDTLRHLMVLMLGLGMRESSGQHCVGRDTTAQNTSSDTAEAGLFQTSWNISSCSDEVEKLFEMWAPSLDAKNGFPQCYLNAFAEGVSCDSSDWDSYGSGQGLNYQDLSKRCPPFHIDVTAIGLRNLRQHWGPINRKEVELLPEADIMFFTIQEQMAPQRGKGV
jgi:hypothetical protein